MTSRRRQLGPRARIGNQWLSVVRRRHSEVARVRHVENEIHQFPVGVPRCSRGKEVGAARPKRRHRVDFEHPRRAV